jgi:hypothetical protein
MILPGAGRNLRRQTDYSTAGLSSTFFVAMLTRTAGSFGGGQSSL